MPNAFMILLFYPWPTLILTLLFPALLRSWTAALHLCSSIPAMKATIVVMKKRPLSLEVVRKKRKLMEMVMELAPSPLHVARSDLFLRRKAKPLIVTI